jgi:hypothetical protein
MTFSQLPPDTKDSGAGNEDPAAASVCPQCGNSCRSGELVCPHCGIILDSGGRTRRINAVDVRLEQKKQMPGEVFAHAEKPITCLFEGRSLLVNVVKSVVFGRRSGIAGDAEPDVDLNPFGADEKGVSRRHVKIQYKSPLFYVTDLGSSNGTWLNGRRLVPNSGRPLRNGDELRLGHLKMSVRF